MPLHRFYATPNIFSTEDKAALSERLTAFYTSIGLPAFYVVILFIDVPEESYYVGGKPRKNYVRIVSQHIARSSSKDQWPRILDKLEASWAPFIKDRGLDWEMHIEYHERNLWRTQGIDPPLPGTEAEKLWVKENKPIPYN